MPGMAPRTGLEGPEDLTVQVEPEVDPYPEGGEEEAPCEECGAPLGMPHEVGCPWEEDPRDPDRAYDGRVDREPYAEGKVLQTDAFDKFMDRIVGEENQRAKADPKHENNPRRQQAARYQDRPMNKTRWGGRRG